MKKKTGGTARRKPRDSKTDKCNSGGGRKPPSFGALPAPDPEAKGKHMKEIYIIDPFHEKISMALWRGGWNDIHRIIGYPHVADVPFTEMDDDLIIFSPNAYTEDMEGFGTRYFTISGFPNPIGGIGVIANLSYDKPQISREVIEQAVSFMPNVACVDIESFPSNVRGGYVFGVYTNRIPIPILGACNDHMPVSRIPRFYSEGESI